MRYTFKIMFLNSSLAGCPVFLFAKPGSLIWMCSFSQFILGLYFLGIKVFTAKKIKILEVIASYPCFFHIGKLSCNECLINSLTPCVFYRVLITAQTLVQSMRIKRGHRGRAASLRGRWSSTKLSVWLA